MVARTLKGLAALLSGLMLWSSFPPQAQAEGAWVALVPLLLLIRHTAPRQAAAWGWLAGMAFWVATLGWFPAIIKNGGPWALVLLGQVALAAWCAGFMGLFGYVSAYCWGWAGSGAPWRRLLVIAVLDPLLWSGGELIRGTLFSGFAWNFLGVSQIANLPVIQVASIFGVYGVSALLVMVNGGVASLIERLGRPLLAQAGVAFGAPERAAGIGRRMLRSLESMLPLALAVLCWSWGVMRLREARIVLTQAPQWRVALIQPNTPCIFIFNDETVRAQRDLLVNQSGMAGAAKPDLVVWPETAVLGSVPYEPATLALIRQGAAAAGAPLLTGVLETEAVPVTSATPTGFLYYNAAWLYDAGGMALGHYRKNHLVPFGEYIPFDKLVPVLQRLAPTGVSCTPGRDPGVLRVKRADGRELALGPLICFEDTVPALSRKSVRAGARMLALMTNDAWFNGSIEPLQHLNQSIFRAVENGVPLVRAANSGVSCVVDATGKAICLASEGGGLVDFSGFLTTQVAVPERPLPAPYTRWGDWALGIPGATLLVALALVAAWRNRAGAPIEVCAQPVEKR